MKRITTTILALLAFMSINAKTITILVKDTRYQTVTGFGAACCDGAMCPYGDDTTPVRLLYGDASAIGLNIMRMEISPNFKGDINDGWDTPYDWHGSLPSAKLVKARGGIVFGTPWSPPGAYKTNGTAQGGNTEDANAKRGELREDCYEKFFPWLNTFLKYMKDNKVNVDAVSVQNEPDWWVNYSGCLYTPQQQVKLVKNYAHLLDRETYNGVRLISAEPLGFAKEYYDAILKDETAREQVDIFAGHIYGHAPLEYIKPVADASKKYNKEIWMTEHSVSDYLKDRLPSWSEQLEFARELNECMISGCTGYIYWYMRAHWAFVGTGETQYGTTNKRNKLLPRAYVMSHFSKHVTGSTRLHSVATGYTTPKTNDPFEYSAYIKGDSLIVMAINSTAEEYDIKLKLPFEVKSGTHLLSTGNETDKLCQTSDITIDEPTLEKNVSIPGNSFSTFIFTINREDETAINAPKPSKASTSPMYFDLHGRRMTTPQGVCIEKDADGSYRKVYIP